MKIVYTILIIAKAFDFISTIIAGLGAEENILVSKIWDNFGVIGFLIFDIISVALLIIISMIIIKLMPKVKRVIAVVLILFAIFITLIALANLGNLIAYDITALIIGG